MAMNACALQASKERIVKRRTSVTQTLVVMAGSAQKQMEHTFVPVWKDTKESTVKRKINVSQTRVEMAEHVQKWMMGSSVLVQQNTKAQHVKWRMFAS